MSLALAMRSLERRLYTRLMEDAGWDESKHPRAANGRFGSGGHAGGPKGGAEGFDWPKNVGGKLVAKAGDFWRGDTVMIDDAEADGPEVGELVSAREDKHGQVWAAVYFPRRDEEDMVAYVHDFSLLKPAKGMRLKRRYEDAADMETARDWRKAKGEWHDKLSPEEKSTLEKGGFVKRGESEIGPGFLLAKWDDQMRKEARASGSKATNAIQYAREKAAKKKK